MLYSAILDHTGRLYTVILGKPHGNTKYHFPIESDRLLEAEQIARSRAPEEWARLSAQRPPKVWRVSKARTYNRGAPTCNCGVPVQAKGEQCYLCSQPKVQPVAKPSDEVLNTLLEVQREWIQSHNVGRFSNWLNARIAQVRAK